MPLKSSTVALSDQTGQHLKHQTPTHKHKSMKILAVNETSTSLALGYYMALFSHGRRYYYAALSVDNNDIISIEAVYKTKKDAFTALGIDK